MLTPKQRQDITELIKAEPFGTPFLFKVAKKLGLRDTALANELHHDPSFEVISKLIRGRNQSCVRMKLSAENLLAILPITAQQLRSAAYPPAELQALLRQMHQAKQLHQKDGQLLPGEGAAPSMGTPKAAKMATSGHLVELDGTDHSPLTQEETVVLSGLENLEEGRINFGLYETYTSIEEIAAEGSVKDKLGDAAVRSTLKALLAKRQIIEPLPGQYRSRVSEIVRLLKNVKQRFDKGDEDSAPYLVQSLQVRFQDRRRLLREKSFSEALNTLRDGDRKVGAAIKLLSTGFSQALGREVQDVKLTNVQERALRAVGKAYLKQAGGSFVVTGNTGSGKTEAALLPLLLGILEEKVREEGRGVKLLLVYPRQNLAKNQLERVCEYVAHLNRAMTGPAGRGLGLTPLSVGIVFGNTPATEAQLKGEQEDKYKRTWKAAHGAFEVPYFSDAAGEAVTAQPRGNGYWKLKSGGGFAGGGWELDTFQAARADILKSPPDILVITTEMLHRWLLDDRAVHIFGLSRDYRQTPPFHPPRALVMDEIHLYSGVHGAQIAALLRRFKHRVSNAMYNYQQEGGWKSPLLIGMSATIGRPQHFWAELSGDRENQIEAITPIDEDYGEAQGRDYYLFIRPESFSRGKRIGDASAAIQTIMTISHNMVRRAGLGGTPAKFRSLIFQDSISKLKKLTVEFRDAEGLKHLSALRAAPQGSNTVFKSRAFMQGEYWYFDAADPFQFSEGRKQPGHPVSTLTSAETPVYSGSGQGAEVLNRDIIFATTSLEVGYDDPSIQFVMQHHAPSNIASFVQKKGRAGRDLNDRPITAVTLSRWNYRDAFYYHNTAALTDPAEYEPALNWENDFVQRFHAVALLLDELVARTGQSWQVVPQDKTLGTHLQTIHDQLTQLDNRGKFITRAYDRVVSASLKAQPAYASWQLLWAWFTSTMLEPEVAGNAGQANQKDLLRLCPEFPENLFSSVNLPVVQVMYPGGQRDEKWKFQSEDVGLTFSELTPGRVSRRYGRHDLYWRPPLMKVIGRERSQQNVVALERYKVRPNRPDGPFNPKLIRDLSAAERLGHDFEKLVPKRVKEWYGGQIPKRFYRLRYLELWSFGRLKPDRPKDPVFEASYFGRRKPDGSVQLAYQDDAEKQQLMKQQDWRVVSPESTSYPLSFAVTQAAGETQQAVALPPLFGPLIPDLQYFFGEKHGERSRLNVWEIQYGAEATVVLHKVNPQDKKAERGINRVTYASEHDGQPMLYGYDMRTEGLRVPYDREVLQDVSEQLTKKLLADEQQSAHLQDQYLRYLLKNEPWTAGVEGGLTPFSQRLMADVLCTMRAEARAQGQSGDQFVAALQSPDGWNELVKWAGIYWADHRTLNEEFIGQASATLADATAFARLTRLFKSVQSSKNVRGFVGDTLLHSLKHAARNMFMMHGSADEQLVGSSVQLNLTHPHSELEAAFYVYERNQDGAGSTRAAARQLCAKPGESLTGKLVNEWWKYTLECPVAEEEQLLKAVLAPARRPAVVAEVRRILQLPAHLRQAELSGFKTVLQQATQGTLELDSPQMGRLATQLLAEINVLGGTFSQMELLLELLDLEGQLCRRFRRLPLPTELAGFALQQVKADDPRTQRLKGVYELYQHHFAHHIEDEDDEGENAADRFLAQVEALSVTTCVDACPACLANSCDLGHIDVMRHSVSRNLLKRAHEWLTASFTVTTTNLTPQEAVERASHSGGFVIHEHVGQLNASVMRDIRAVGFEQQGRIFDPEQLKIRTIHYRTVDRGKDNP